MAPLSGPHRHVEPPGDKPAPAAVASDWLGTSAEEVSRLEASG